MSIEEIKRRHIKNSWKVGEYSTDYYKQGYQVLTENGGVVAECIDDSKEAEFIAHAPADIALLLEQNQRLQSELTYLHQQIDILYEKAVEKLVQRHDKAYKLLEKKD